MPPRHYGKLPRTLALVGVSLGMSLALMGCSSLGSGATAHAVAGSYQTVSPAQLLEMLKRKDFFLVNVHIPYAGEIPATDAFIAYDETTQRIGEYPADKGAKIVVYCRTNHMSGIAAHALVEAGYTHVYLLDGGMNGWQDAGFSLGFDEAKRK